MHIILENETFAPITTHRIFWQKISKKPNFHHISQTLSVNQEVKGYIWSQNYIFFILLISFESLHPTFQFSPHLKLAAHLQTYNVYPPPHSFQFTWNTCPHFPVLLKSPPPPPPPPTFQSTPMPLSNNTILIPTPTVRLHRKDIF